MPTETEPDLFSNLTERDLLRWLLADLHDDLDGKISRFRQLVDLSGSLGSGGTMMPGGETTYSAWNEARVSFIHGNYVATVMLCQGLAEHILAAQLEVGLGGEPLPNRVAFSETLKRCLERKVISDADVFDLKKLMGLRNPLSHFRNINDPSNLSRRAINSMEPAIEHLGRDASFAISLAVRLLALPAFRLGPPMNQG